MLEHMIAAGAPRVGVFHPGTQHSLQAALAFQEGGQLAWHATSVFYDPARWPYRIERYLPPPFKARVGREFRRRFNPDLNAANVRHFGLEEWFESLARRMRLRRLAARLNHVGNARFARRVIELAGREPADVLWGYNGSSREVFRWARGKGIRCVLDQTTIHPRSFNRIMADAHKDFPDYFCAGGSVRDDDFIAQQDEEMALADVVVCGSAYCAETMRENGCAPQKIRILPYGFDDRLFPDDPPRRAPLAGRAVNFLFVGTVAPGKGIPYLLEAFARVPASDATLTLVGQLAIPAATLRRFAGRVRHIGQLPRTEVIEHFRAADCFIFPSLFEGGGIVLYEAAAAGLGIVQTRFCGDGVRGGANGVSLEQVTVENVLGAIRTILDDREMLARWQQASWHMRGERSWSVYRRAIRELIIP